MKSVYENIGFISAFLDRNKEQITGEECIQSLKEIKEYVRILEKTIATEISWDKLDELRGE